MRIHVPTTDAVQDRHDQRRREKLARRRVRHRRSIPIAVVTMLIAVAMPSAAEEPFSAGNSVVITALDEFTDAYRSTILGLGIGDRAEDDAAGLVAFYHRADGTYELGYWVERYYTPPHNQYRTNVLVRIDRLEAERATGWWDEDRTVILVEITKDNFVRMLDLIVTATRLIYRIHGSETLSVTIPDEIGDLVAEFRRRVDARGEHALSARSSLRPHPEVKPAMTFAEAAENRRRLTGN